jgi:hypothetical protein
MPVCASEYCGATPLGNVRGQEQVGLVTDKERAGRFEEDCPLPLRCRCEKSSGRLSLEMGMIFWLRRLGTRRVEEEEALD